MNFDKYYILEDSNQFSISASKPMLYPDDVVRIFKSEPAAKEQTTSELYYDYVLEKQYQAGKDEQGDYNIKLRFVFTDGKLNKLLIDERFFAILPKNVVAALARSLGDAKIDVRNRRLSLNLNVSQIHLPDVNEVAASLGKPSWQKDNRYVYNYLRKNPNEKNNNGKPAWADFVFDKQGKCIKCRNRVFGIPFEMDTEKQLLSGTKTDGQTVQLKIVVNR